MHKKHIVRLNKDERQQLDAVIKKLSGSSQKVRRAPILLKADAFRCRTQTVENIRQRFVEFGFKQTLDGKKRAELLEGRYANCEQVTLVCDNLNTHTRGAFYEVFEAQRARALVKRINWCYTPKHGSWLNIAENELSSITRQCVGGRRIGTIEELATEIAAWSSSINAKQRGVDWQMKVDDARCKLKSVYPKIRV